MVLTAGSHYVNTKSEFIGLLKSFYADTIVRPLVTLQIGEKELTAIKNGGSVILIRSTQGLERQDHTEVSSIVLTCVTNTAAKSWDLAQEVRGVTTNLENWQQFYSSNKSLIKNVETSVTPYDDDEFEDIQFPAVTGFYRIIAQIKKY